METPVRISESAGGSADWGFARMSFVQGGAERERLELNHVNFNPLSLAHSKDPL
jgi:hypothetical protein